MEFGIFLTLPSPLARPSKEIYDLGLELIVQAEALGFHSAWLAEHHFTTYSYVASPLVVLANAAAKTQRIRLGTAIIPMPLHNPLLVAEEIATVDVLSNGRIEFGIGKGYQKYQFERLGLTKQDDETVFTESVELACRALSGEPFEFHGQHFHVDETLIFPQPLQKPIPTWMVVNTQKPALAEFALQHNMGLFTGVLEPINKLKNLRVEWAERFPVLAQGHPLGTQRPVFVTHDRRDIDEAIEAVRWNARVSVSQRYDAGRVEQGRAVAEVFHGEPTTEEILENFVVFGTPDDCIRQLKRIEQGLGCNYFNASFLFGALDPDKVKNSMRLFAEEVIPAFR